MSPTSAAPGTAITLTGSCPDGADSLVSLTSPVLTGVTNVKSNPFAYDYHATVKSTATAGRAVLLAGAVIRYIVTDTLSLRLPVGEVVVQVWTLYKVTALPALLMAIPFGGMVAVQSSGLINQVGANSLVGAASGVGVVRQGAPITAGLLMGGAAAAAIA